MSDWKLTSGSDDWFNSCMFREGFHALLFCHVEDQTLLYQVLHLYSVVRIIKKSKNSRKKTLKKTSFEMKQRRLAEGHRNTTTEQRKTILKTMKLYIRNQQAEEINIKRVGSNMRSLFSITMCIYEADESPMILSL